MNFANCCPQQSQEPEIPMSQISEYDEFFVSNHDKLSYSSFADPAYTSTHPSSSPPTENYSVMANPSYHSPHMSQPDSNDVYVQPFGWSSSGSPPLHSASSNPSLHTYTANGQASEEDTDDDLNNIFCGLKITKFKFTNDEWGYVPEADKGMGSTPESQDSGWEE